MLKLLGKLLNRDLITPEELIDTNVPEDEIWKILRPNSQAELLLKKKNLQPFVKFATRQLSKTESERLCQVAIRALDDCEDPFEAMGEVMSGQQRGSWVFIQLDWKDGDEIVWQVSEILSTFNVNERWERDCATEFEEMPEALLALSDWLAARDFALLHFETGADCYCSLIVRVPDVSTAKELAAAAQLKLYDQAEFFRSDI